MALIATIDDPAVIHRKNWSYVTYDLTDTGAGIAPEDQAKIFEAFSQVGTDQARKREGNGLGLTLTRRFVELHGGKISVERTVGKVSTFAFALPVRPWPVADPHL